MTKTQESNVIVDPESVGRQQILCESDSGVLFFWDVKSDKRKVICMSLMLGVCRMW